MYKFITISMVAALCAATTVHAAEPYSPDSIDAEHCIETVRVARLVGIFPSKEAKNVSSISEDDAKSFAKWAGPYDTEFADRCIATLRKFFRSKL